MRMNGDPTLDWFAFESAGIACSIKDDFMVFDTESGRSHFLDAFEAFFQLEDLAALAAQKMVVVLLVGPLVARRLAGNFHRNDTPIFREGFQRTIDRGESDRRDFPMGQFLNFGGGKWVLVRAENSLDRAFLFSTTVHASS